MSALNRGSERQNLDLYQTPYSSIDRFLEEYGFGEDEILYDPCAGGCNIIQRTKLHSPDNKWIATEIDPKHEDALQKAEVPYLIKDFLQITDEDIKQLTNGKRVNTIFTNPPYSLAMEFIQKSLKIADTVIMLLRVNFLGSIKRNKFLRQHTPSIYVLPNRPSFINGKTDATDYAWFVWDNRFWMDQARISILKVNP